jgi:serine protease Do
MAERVHRAKVSVVSVHTFVEKGREGRWRVGSGFIYSRSGFIVTRCSVVSGADSVAVSFTNGRRLPAYIVYFDPRLQIALLRVPSEDLEPLSLTSSTRLHTKSMLTVLGNSLGVFPSVSLGTYMGRRRDGMLIIDILPSPGNCGGPVLNDFGQVVGIMVGRMIGSSDLLGEQLGLALPIERVRPALDEFIRQYDLNKGWVGLSVIGLGGVSEGRGVLVTQLVPGSPADQAGIIVGDTLIAFEGRPIEDPRVLAKWVKESPPDHKVVFTLRKGDMAITRLVRVRSWR